MTTERCERCKGAGWGGTCPEGEPVEVICLDCNGTGQKLIKSCPRCNSYKLSDFQPACMRDAAREIQPHSWHHTRQREVKEDDDDITPHPNDVSILGGDPSL